MSDSENRGRPDRSLWLVAIVVLPLVVSAAVIIVRQADFRPISDYALAELQVRDIGRHEVLTGLYSRSDWSHPGPMFFYMVAPLYRLMGDDSISMNLVALVINAAAVAGIALLSWRRGGTAMLLCAVLGSALVMRTLGAETLYDSWNNYLVALPFGLLLFATWALLCGDRWVLPIAVVTASFLAQTHVGFVPLAIPLLVLGAAWLVVTNLRAPTDPDQRRSLLQSLALSATIGVVLWAPTVFDLVTNEWSNPRKTWGYFRTSPDEAQSILTGWRIVASQFTWPPEWLVTKRFDLVGYGESPFKFESVLPWLLLPVILAALFWWRRRPDDSAGARYLSVVLAAAMVIGAVAVMRTLGPVLDYRLRWTWMLGLAGFVLVAWTLWQLAVRRWAHIERRVLVPVASALIIVVSGINVFAASTVAPPWDADSEVMAYITPKVLGQVEPDQGQVVVTDRLSDSAWYTRGLVLQLERAGVDARVPPDVEALFGRSRVVQGDERIQATLLLVQRTDITKALRDPSLRLVARWRPEPGSSFAEELRRRARLDRQLEAGTLTPAEHQERFNQPGAGSPHHPGTADLGVFIYKRPSGGG